MQCVAGAGSILNRMVIYATEYEKRLIVQALRDYARNCPGGTQDQAATLAAEVEQAYRP